MRRRSLAQCMQVVVPLDRSGAAPGNVALHVEFVPAKGTPRGAVFLLARGPGRGSAHVFDIAIPSPSRPSATCCPGYSIVAYDDRGTYDSGLLDRPPLQRSDTADAERDAAAALRRRPPAAARLLLDHRPRLQLVRSSGRSTCELAPEPGVV